MGKKKAASATSATSEAKVTKTQAIKAALAANRKMGPKEISTLLREQGVDVSPAYVSTIKTSVKKKKGGKKAAVAKKAASSDNSYASLIAAKKLVEEIGSVEEAKKAIDALGKLLG